MPALGQLSHAFPVPKIRVDVAQREAEEVLRAQLRSVSPENWAGGRLSARGLDALQSIRDAAQQHLTLRQNSESPVGSITESQSPSPRSRTRRKSARSRAAAGKSPLRSPTSPLVRYRPPEQEPELEMHGVLKSSILPLPPDRICGLPARSLRFQKKTPEPPIPMYATSETEGACLDRKHNNLTNRERHESAGRRHLGGFVDAQRYQNQDWGAHTERREGLGVSTIGKTNVQTISFPCETSGLSIALAPTRRSRLSCPRWSCLKTKHCFGANLQTSAFGWGGRRTTEASYHQTTWRNYTPRALGLSHRNKANMAQVTSKVRLRRVSTPSRTRTWKFALLHLTALHVLQVIERMHKGKTPPVPASELARALTGTSCSMPLSSQTKKIT